MGLIYWLGRVLAYNLHCKRTVGRQNHAGAGSRPAASLLTCPTTQKRL